MFLFLDKSHREEEVEEEGWKKKKETKKKSKIKNEQFQEVSITEVNSI